MATLTPVRPAGQLLTIDGLAEMLQISASSIYRHRSLGHPMPPAVKVGGQLRWRVQDVDDFLADNLEEAA